MRYYYFIFLALLSGIFPMYAYGMELSPTGYRITADPQSSELLPFTLTNTTDHPQQYTVSVRDGMHPQGISTIAPWFRLPSTMTLAPQETTVFEVEAYVPPTAMPGDRYVYLIVSQEQDAAVLGSQPEAGIPLTITVAGDITESVQLRELQLSRIQATLSGSVEFVNTGNIEVPIVGTLRLAQDTDRLSEVPIQTRLRAGDAVRIPIEAVQSPWYVGPVVVQATVQYGILDTYITDRHRIFVVGRYTLIAALSGGILFFVIGVGWYRKKNQYVA